MKKIFLINPPVYYEQDVPMVLDVSVAPLGLMYLAAILEKEKIKIKFIDIGAEKQTLSKTLKLIKKEKPLIVGITAMTPVLQGAITLAKNIKKQQGNKTKICLGGPHISADPEFIKRIKYFDFAVTGEAEITFLRLVKDILKRKKINGIYQGQPIENLDTIPFPARHLLNHDLYIKTASLIASRGCPFNCYYCSRPAVSNKVRCRSPQNIIKEMDKIYSIYNGNYHFQDDSFTINRENTVSLCRELINRPKKYRWSCLTRIDLVDEELLSLMSKAGCHSIAFGIESGNQKVRNTIVGKTFSNQKIIETIKLCNKYKINADGFFMIGHPTETKKQIESTTDFILKNNFNIIGVSIATPFPGSKLWQYAVKDKIIDIPLIDKFALGEIGAGYAGVYPSYKPKDITYAWLYHQRRLIMRQFYLRPKKIIKRIITNLGSPQQIKKDFIEGINVLFKGSSARSPYKKENKD